MKRILIGAYLLFVSVQGFCEPSGFLPQKGEAYKIVMHNKPLVKIHGKTFSVMDVRKHMDFFLQEHHPETFSSTLLLYQFYAQNWRFHLQEMINDELIKMEAESYKITISDGDIREQMEKRFGPNVVKKLDELGLTHDEAKDLIRDEIVVRNMSWYRIWAKVLQTVTPELVKAEYDGYVAKLALPDQWTYKMVSLKGNDATALIARKTHDLLTAAQSALDAEIPRLNDKLPENALLTVSDTIKVDAKDLAPEILSALKPLQAHHISAPVMQKSKVDGTPVYRMFYLIDHQKETPPPFEQLSSKIHDLLVQKYGEIQKEEYFAKLRKRFFHEDLVIKTLFPASYQPFTLCES